MFLLRKLIKDYQKRQEYEKAISDALNKYNEKYPRVVVVRDAWNKIIEKMKEDQAHGLQQKEKEKTDKET